MNGWWLTAGVLLIVGTPLWLLANHLLVAANRYERVPYFRRVTNRPTSVVWLQPLSIGILCNVTGFVANGFWRHGRTEDYLILWGLPFVAAALLIGLIPVFRHNHRIVAATRRRVLQ